MAQTTEDILRHHAHTAQNFKDAQRLKVGDLVILSLNGNLINHNCPGEPIMYMLWTVSNIGTQGLLLIVDTGDILMQSTIGYEGMFDLYKCGQGAFTKDCDVYNGDAGGTLWALNTDY